MAYSKLCCEFAERLASKKRAFEVVQSRSLQIIIRSSSGMYVHVITSFKAQLTWKVRVMAPPGLLWALSA